MPIELITGPANAGKAELAMDGIRRHMAGGREPALVVPTRADAERYRRELAGEGALFGAQVWRFEDLIAEAVRRAGIEGPVLGGIARYRLVAALAAQEPALPPRFAPAMTQLFAELHAKRIAPARLRGALAPSNGRAGSSGPAAAAAAVYERYEATLSRIGCRDEEQRAVQALDALRKEPARWRDRPVVVYGFDDLTPLQLDAIHALGVEVDAEVTVSLTFEEHRAAFAGRAGALAALLPLSNSHRRLGARPDFYAPSARAVLAHLERSLFEAPCTRPAASDALQLLEGASERDELELVAARIVELIEAGVDPAQIAVVTRAAAPSLELLEEVFAAAGIPHTPKGRRRFGDSAIGAALIGLLRCVSGGEARDLLAWLRCPGVLSTPELADGLEAGLARTGAASALEARAEWERRHWPLDAIDQLASAQERGAAALARRAARELAWLFAAPRHRQAELLTQEEELEEARALAAGRRALAELAELAHSAPELAARHAGELADALERVEVPRGSDPLAGAVAVLDPLALRARRVRALFLCGMREGAFPSSFPRPHLLGEGERTRLDAAAGTRSTDNDLLAAERFLLYASLSRAEELVVLSWHAAREDGTPQARSLFVDDVCDLFAPPISVRRKDGAGGGEGPGDAPRVPSSDNPIAPLRDGPIAPLRDGPIAPLRDGPIAPLRDPRVLEEMRAHAWSASSLEVWISCPVRWLVERVLRAKELGPDPEPLSRGGLAHAVLRQTLAGLRERTGSARLTPASLSPARELLAGALAEHEPRMPLSTSPERRLGLRRRLQADLERYLEHAAQTAGDSERRGALEPTHFELEFGLGQASPDGEGPVLPALDLGDGVGLRGRIDRVDIGAAGEAVVYDYKGKNASPAAKWLSEGSVQVALYMIACEQLLGVRAVGGFYQPLTGSDLRPRGVLDRDGGVQLECVRGDARSREEVCALLEQAAATALEAAGQARRGELEPRPWTCTLRGGCAHPTVCRCRR